MANLLRDEESSGSEAEEVAELGDADLDDPQDHPMAPWRCEGERMSMQKFKEMEDEVFRIWSSRRESSQPWADGEAQRLNDWKDKIRDFPWTKVPKEVFRPLLEAANVAGSMRRNE